MTKEQEQSIQSYIKQDYIWDKSLSVSFCAVVLRKGNILNIYGLGGEIDINKRIEDFQVIKV